MASPTRKLLDRCLVLHTVPSTLAFRKSANVPPWMMPNCACPGFENGYGPFSPLRAFRK